MKKLIILFFPFILIENTTAQSNSSSSWGERYTQLFFNQQFDSIVIKMDSTTKSRMKGIQGLTSFYNDIVVATGESPVFEKAIIDTANGVFVSKQIGKGDISFEFVWSFNNEGTIKSLSAKPIQAEAVSKYLDYIPKTKLQLPFNDTWTVFAGGRTLATNHHAIAKNQRYAMDIAIMKNGKTYINEGKNLTDYYVWGKELIAPADGKIVVWVDGFPDNEIGTTDTKNVAGNYLVIDHENGEFSLLAHFKNGSFVVKNGDTVKKGQVLGLVGNSGNTTEPHLHYHLQDGANFPESECMPATFYNYIADGKLMQKGEPAQGEQVANQK